MYSDSDGRPSLCEMVEARFTDLPGRVKAMAIPLSAPADDPARIAQDPAVAAGIGVDGSRTENTRPSHSPPEAA